MSSNQINVNAVNDNLRYHDKKYPVTIAVRLTEDQHKKLQKTKVSISAMVRTLIESL